jgi:hypothetical protein
MASTDTVDVEVLVTWIEHPEPWVVEKKLIRELALPLNLQGNDHLFRPVLRRLRTDAKARARRKAWCRVVSEH